VSEKKLEPRVAEEIVELMLAWSNDFLGTGGPSKEELERLFACCAAELPGLPHCWIFVPLSLDALVLPCGGGLGPVG
jgi:hypothetical protein